MTTQIIRRDPPLVLNNGDKIVGTVIEIETTRDHFEDLGLAHYRMTPIPPRDGSGWRIFDASRDKKTDWCRDLYFIVEAAS